MSNSTLSESAKAKNQLKQPLRKIGAYMALTKPRVIELLLITTVPAMVLAAQGLPNFWLVIATLIGGALSAGSANAFNCYIDTDIDKVMGRTRNRPLVTGELSAKEALWFSWLIGIGSVLWLGLAVNWLASGISLAALLFYVFVYTLGLKRKTPQNIVWGGAAGAAPVLIGWAAVTGTVAWPAVVMFLIVFLWTPPHYWPLSVKYRDDYELAKVPMLPVVRGTKTVVQQILIYAWAVAAASLLLIPVAGMGSTYTITAIVVSSWFIVASYRMYKEGMVGELQAPMKLFHFSNLHLTALFLAIALDPLVQNLF
jgi:protoheme IX farnesyltransferase